jgi:hypothetical protein
VSLVEVLREVEEAFAAGRDGDAWTLAWRIAHRLTES